jgi:5-methylcytosine-specific restriction protein A
MSDRNQAYDARRSAESATRRLYWTQRWRRRAAHQLLLHPLCHMCQTAGRVTAASVADHVVPHRGDVDSFWGGALASLCQSCHSRTKQREEARGFADSVDADGWPTDPRHPANAHHGAKVEPQGGVSTPPGGILSLQPSAPAPAANHGAQNREMRAGGRNNG